MILLRRADLFVIFLRFENYLCPMVSQEGWGDLATKLNEWLKGFAEQHGLMHRNQHQAIPGFPHNGFKSDGLVTDTDGRRIIAVEIEYGQTHPDTNVGKYWLLYEKRRYEKLVLIHVFLHYRRRHRRDLAKFYVEKMINSGVPIEYIVLDDICYENIDDVLSKIKSKIREEYENIFGQST